MSREDFLQSAVWRYKVEEYVFKKQDLDKDGYVTPAEHTDFLVGQLEKFGPDPKAVDAFRDALDALVMCCNNSSVGVRGTEPISKEDFLKVLAEIAEGDLEKMKRGEEPILLKSMEACFDLMDTDHDGFVTLDEYKRMMTLGQGWEEEEADVAVKQLDRNNSGKLSRQDIIQVSYDFWYKYEDDKTQGLEQVKKYNPWTNFLWYYS